ncbi:TetR family transcriptional regulator [Weizmannia acidilactici]|uniref:TetR family transcriptional regulator n=1 Tax=Weizmannia acidilactici TaxID=2607726 RepID=A0A5J4JKB3_9BACI|nr:TetR/AcrR family transcriptional regulator [Weizmannia acidilactici]GER68046.1 TetR family transcriptional regulator [Weizmannia acidilactici]GER70787.1 TetR family transcriptional regulator [Weizmannia acidilactici]GER74351.1 TetR family transcriptional regulator [Weizmannia acidilactici]
MSKYNLLEAMKAQAKPALKLTDKKQKIMETAVALFAEKGYSNTPTSEIAKAAGVAEGTIFRHFGTKDNLLVAVIVPFLKASIPSMAEELFTELMSHDVFFFEDFLRELVRDRLNFVKENKEIFQIVVKEFLYNEEIRNELLPYFVENIGGRLIQVIRVFQERGELVSRPAEDIAKLVVTCIAGLFVSKFVLMLNGTADEEAEIETIVRFVMDGVRKRE